ncbi:unknown [Bacteroides sp. CAG:702]|nr:unknown [Bacteroides sp. CAG:702]
MTGRYDFHSTLQSVRTVHGNATYGILTDMLLHFDYQRTPIVTNDSQRIVDFRQGFFHILSFFQFEVHIDHRTDDLRNVSNDF